MAVQAVIEVDKGIGRPQLLANFFPGNHVARPLEQQRQYLEGLFLESYAPAAFA